MRGRLRAAGRSEAELGAGGTCPTRCADGKQEEPTAPSLRSFPRALRRARSQAGSGGQPRGGPSQHGPCEAGSPTAERGGRCPDPGAGGLHGPAPRSPGGRGGPGALVHHVVVIIAQPQLHVFETRPLLHPAKGRPRYGLSRTHARPAAGACGRAPRPLPHRSPTAQDFVNSCR